MSLETKQTQCPICKKGKRDVDRFCSEKCSLVGFRASPPAWATAPRRGEDPSHEAQRESFARGNLAIDRDEGARRTIYKGDPHHNLETLPVLEQDIHDAEFVTRDGHIYVDIKTKHDVRMYIDNLSVCDVCGEEFDPVFGRCRNANHVQKIPR